MITKILQANLIITQSLIQMVSQQGGFDRSIFYHLTVVSCAHKLFYIVATNWGKPEQAPHKREVRAACLSVCLSVRTFMTRKYTR